MWMINLYIDIKRDIKKSNLFRLMQNVQNDFENPQIMNLEKSQLRCATLRDY